MQIPRGKIFAEAYSIPMWFSKKRYDDRYISLTPDHYDKYKDVTWYDITNQLAEPCNDENIDFVFTKEMAYHVTEPHTTHFNKTFLFELLSLKLAYPTFHHTFLIRDPRKVALSMYKALTARDREFYINVNDVYDVYKQCEHFGFDNLVIVDADDLLTDPADILSKYCSKVGLKYSDKILSWDPGYDANEHTPLLRLWDGWHDNIINSNGFQIRKQSQEEREEKERKIEKEVSELPKWVQLEIGGSMAAYEKLYGKRLRLDVDEFR